MHNKHWLMEVGQRRFDIDAEQESAGHFMIGMRELDTPKYQGRIRIGYLTGAKKNWVAEFPGGRRPSVRAKSAKEACIALAEFAITQQGDAA
jgi:hypothetical protein